MKLTSQPDAQDLERLDRAADLIGATRRILVSQTARAAFSARRVSCDLESFLDHLRQRS